MFVTPALLQRLRAVVSVCSLGLWAGGALRRAVEALKRVQCSIAPKVQACIC